MKLENLPDGGHDKEIWKRSRVRSGDKASQQRNTETWWRRTTATLLGVSFGTYITRRRDVLMGRTNRCFIWNLFETSWRCTDGSSSLRSLEMSLWHINKTSWRRTTETSWGRSTETSLDVSFETHLCCDVQRDVVTTSPRRLVAGWVAINYNSFYLSFIDFFIDSITSKRIKLHASSHYVNWLSANNLTNWLRHVASTATRQSSELWPYQA